MGFQVKLPIEVQCKHNMDKFLQYLYILREPTIMNTTIWHIMGSRVTIIKKMVINMEKT